MQRHLNTFRADQSDGFQEIERSLHVDNIVTGGQSTEESLKREESYSGYLPKNLFTLHKWNSNKKALEESDTHKTEEGLSHAKKVLGVKH